MINTKRLFQLFLMVAVLMVSFTTSLDAQTYGVKKKKKKKKKTQKKTDDYFDDRGTFKDQLWYGADVSLGFSGVQGGNAFTAGIAPMAGYKITDNFSIGPRLEVLYSGYRFNNGTGPDIKLNATNYGVGAFSRLKILDLYFLHFEYQALNAENPVVVNGSWRVDSDNKIISARNTSSHYYIGGGYSSSNGVVGFQATLLWDLSQEYSSTNIPIVSRLGINYKF